MKNRLVGICHKYFYYEKEVYLTWEERSLGSADLIWWEPVNRWELEQFKQKELFIWEE